MCWKKLQHEKNFSLQIEKYNLYEVFSNLNCSYIYFKGLALCPNLFSDILLSMYLILVQFQPKQ